MDKDYIFRSNFRDELAKHFKFKSKEKELLVQCVYASIERAIEKHGKVKLGKFGTLKIVERKEHKWRNPRTGRTIYVPPKKTLKFCITVRYKRKLNEVKEEDEFDYI